MTKVGAIWLVSRRYKQLRILTGLAGFFQRHFGSPGRVHFFALRRSKSNEPGKEKLPAAIGAN